MAAQWRYCSSLALLGRHRAPTVTMLGLQSARSSTALLLCSQLQPRTSAHAAHYRNSMNFARVESHRGQLLNPRSSSASLDLQCCAASKKASTPSFDQQAGKLAVCPFRGCYVHLDVAYYAHLSAGPELSLCMLSFGWLGRPLPLFSLIKLHT